MGNQVSFSQSKDELLYQQVNYGNVDGIKQLCQEGAGLEWIDKEGKTPLIVACLNAELYNVSKALIDLGANVNAYRPEMLHQDECMVLGSSKDTSTSQQRSNDEVGNPLKIRFHPRSTKIDKPSKTIKNMGNSLRPREGIHAGTPLHHAAKRGLEHTVKLLLSSGANAYVMNDDCQTPLDIARVKGYTNVVRTIEQHTSPFFGFLRELHGPGFLEAIASQWLSKKVWVVIIPCASRNASKPLRLQLAMYPTSQDARPRNIISLWKAKIEEPKFHQSDPTMTIFDDHTKTRYKFASENEGDKQQLQWFYSACIGISQATYTPLPPTSTAPLIPPTAPPTSAEDVELSLAINASVNSAVERPSIASEHSGSGVGSTNNWSQLEGTAPPSKWDVLNPGPSSSSSHQSAPPVTPATTGTTSTPSAPPIPDDADIGPVHYPEIDSSPIDLPSQTTAGKVASTSEVKEDGSSCVICLDAPVEAACIPCGHMAGCMSCLNEIKAKKWGCPVCRAKIQQVVRLYAV